MTFFKHIIALAGISFVTSSIIFGQAQKDSLEYNLGVNISGRRISGTFNQVVAGGGFTADLRFGNWHLENKTTYRFNKTNERVIEDNWYDLAILKYYPKGKQKIYPGVFYHFDNNLMFRVKRRHQYGVGVGSVLNKGAMKLSLMAAIANENSFFNGSDFVNSDRDFANRKSGMFLFKFNNGYSIAKQKINFSYQLFYFQSLKEATDYDIWLNSRVSFNMFKSLSFHVMYDYRFENVHLEPLSTYNDIFLFGLNWNISG